MKIYHGEKLNKLFVFGRGAGLLTDNEYFQLGAGIFGNFLINAIWLILYSTFIGQEFKQKVKLNR